MFKRLSPLRLVALFVLVASPSLVRAQTLADHVPADTTLYVGWAGIDSPGPGFQGSHLQDVLSDSNLNKVFDDFLPKILDRIGQEDRDGKEVVDVIKQVFLPMWHHPSALAFVTVTIDPRTGPKPKLLLLCQPGNDAAAFKAGLEDAVMKLKEAPFTVNVVTSGDILGLAIGFDNPETAIPAAAGSLAARPEFVKALAQVGKDSFFTAYVDVEKVVALGDMAAALNGPKIENIWLKAKDVLGLRGVKNAIWTEGFDGKDWSSRAFVAAPAPRAGLLAGFLEGRQLSKEVYSVIPANSTIAGAGHLDLAALVTGIRSAITAFDLRAGAEADRAIEQVNQAIGMDVQKDLLGSFGDEWAYYVDPAVAGNGIVSATFVNHLKDAAKAEASLIKLEAFINQTIAQEMHGEKMTIAFKTAKINDTTVHYLALPLVSPSWAIANGNLYFALYPEIVGAAGHTPAKSILENPAFTSLMRRLGEHPVSSFGFADLPRLAPETYSTWLVISKLINFGDMFGVSAPVQILPPLDKLLTHLAPSGGISWTDDDGLHFNGITPFPGSELFASDPGTFAIGELAMGASVIMPAMNRARASAMHARNAANFHTIGFAAFTYANNHNGKLPKDIGELYSSSGLPIEAFVNPAMHGPIPHNLPADQAAQWVIDNTDYVWNGSGKNSGNVGALDLIAWENPQRSDGTVNILYGDFHVQSFPTYMAMDIIQKATAPK